MNDLKKIKRQAMAKRVAFSMTLDKEYNKSLLYKPYIGLLDEGTNAWDSLQKVTDTLKPLPDLKFENLKKDLEDIIAQITPSSEVFFLEIDKLNFLKLGMYRLDVIQMKALVFICERYHTTLYVERADEIDLYIIDFENDHMFDRYGFEHTNLPEYRAIPPAPITDFQELEKWNIETNERFGGEVGDF